MPETTVINIRLAPDGWQQNPDYVYIGRTNYSWGLKDLGFGNPFQVGHYTRKQAVKMHETWARELIAHDPKARAAVQALHGKTLVCWCHPLACHGHTLAKLADELTGAGE